MPDLIDLHQESFSMKREELASMNIASLLDKKQRTRAQKAIEDLKQTGTQRPLTEYKLRFKNGKEIHIETKLGVNNQKINLRTYLMALR